MGNANRHVRIAEAARFIPTCVGNAEPVLGRLKFSPVHPHVCGERAYRYFSLIYYYGSSPRVWGTHILMDITPILKRFIPTCVGNASSSDSYWRPSPVHPHVCGERASAARPNSFFNGSSPRVWGTPMARRLANLRLRFIPTCVGNAELLIMEIASPTVHPHVCGERTNNHLILLLCNGSSPRVWGTL